MSTSGFSMVTDLYSWSRFIITKFTGVPYPLVYCRVLTSLWK